MPLLLTKKSIAPFWPLIVLWLVASAQAIPLFGNSFSGNGGAALYDINPLTGEAKNQRSTGIEYLVGIALSPDHTLYGLSNDAESRTMWRNCRCSGQFSPGRCRAN